MKSLILFTWLLLLGPVAAPAQLVTTRVDARTSEISYAGSSFVHDWEGTSRRVTGTLAVDMARPEASRIEISAPVESFDSGNENRDSNMLDAVEAERYPNVSFVSSQITAGQGGTWTVRGTLSFHGRTKQIEIPVRVSGQNGVFEGSGTFPISLTEFKVKRPKLLLKPIADEIQVTFTIRAPLKQ